MSVGYVSRVRVPLKAWNYLNNRGRVYVFLPYRRRRDVDVVEATLYKNGRVYRSVKARCIFDSEYVYDGLSACKAKIKSILHETGYRRVNDLMAVYKIASIYNDKKRIPFLSKYYIYRLELLGEDEDVGNP